MEQRNCWLTLCACAGGVIAVCVCVCVCVCYCSSCFIAELQCTKCIQPDYSKVFNSWMSLKCKSYGAINAYLDLSPPFSAVILAYQLKVYLITINIGTSISTSETQKCRISLTKPWLWATCAWVMHMDIADTAYHICACVLWWTTMFAGSSEPFYTKLFYKLFAVRNPLVVVSMQKKSSGYHKH